MNVKRMSRPLVGILGLTLLVGALAYTARHHHNPTSPPPAVVDVTSSPPNSSNGVAAVKPGGGTDAAPAAAHLPADPPATRPALVAVAFNAPPSAGPALSGTEAFGQGSVKLNAGDLLGGRKILNDALNAGSFSAADTTAAKKLIAQANQTLVFSPQHFSDDPYCGTFTVPSGGVMARIAKTYAVTPELLSRINGLSDPRKLRAGQVIKIVQGPFHAVVTKGAFTIDLYLGGVPGEKSALYVTTFPVGLGKDNSTPSGTWIVEPGRKLTNPKYYSPRGQGTFEAGDPMNPLGKFWIGLAGTEGQAVGQTHYGIHGTIDPDSIGKMASMGCIRLRNEDIALVYEMLVEGKSTVIVKD